MKYKVVRTTLDDIDTLQNLFEEGWQYKSCNQTECKHWNSRYAYEIRTCLEYILYKKENKDEKENR